MDLMQQIEENPMVSFDNAYNIITCATILQHGISYPEDVNAAFKRIKSNIAMLMGKDNAISRCCRGGRCPDEYAASEDIDFEEYFGYGFSQHESTVNIKQLIDSYNYALESNGLSPVMTISNTTQTTQNTSESILLLISLVANTLKNIFDRDHKITNEQLDSMLNEISTQIVDPSVYKLLPEIKTTLKAIAKDKITPGRPSTVDVKKMMASIDLAETFKDKTRQYLSLKDVAAHLRKHHSDLSKTDREHVAEVYLISKGE